MDTFFNDVHFIESPHFSVTYRSGMTTYEEGLYNGVYVSLGWNGAGYSAYNRLIPGPAVLDTSNFPEPQAFMVEIDGQSLGSHWELKGYNYREEKKGLYAEITLRHLVRPVEVKINTFLDGTAIITRWIEIINLGEKSAALGMTAPLSGGLQCIKRWRNHVKKESSPYRLGYMEYTEHQREGGFRWHDLPNAGYYFGSRFIRSRYRHPMFILEDKAMGCHFICQFAWSGGYRFAFDLNTEGENSYLSFSTSLDAPKPLRIIAPGESVKSPEVHIGMLYGDLDDCVNAMHEHVRKSVIMPQARDRGMWIESGIGPNINLTEEAVKHRIDFSADIGAEIFYIDASWYYPSDETEKWYSRVGDWEPKNECYPVNIDDIRDYAHLKGLLFGLWMEPERFGADSNAFKEHPDWCTLGYDKKVKGAYAGGGGMVDLAKPEASVWVEEQMADLIERFKLDFFRLDFNVGTMTPFSFNLKDGYLENCDWRYYEAFYSIMERLRARFPDVIFEACASGGARTDFGLVRHYCHTWVTDYQLAPRSFAITNGMTMCLPPENIDRLLTGQDGFTTASLEFQARLLLFVRPSIGCSVQLGFAANTVQLDRIRHMLEIYKSFVRPIMSNSKIYHHTPEVDGLDPKGTGILEMVSEKRDKAMLGIFQLSDPDLNEKTVFFRGIDSSKQYKVTLDNSNELFTVDGYVLKMKGLNIRLGGALTSELILVEALN